MVCGLAYGVIVHVVMNQVVLPLSRVTFRTPPWSFVAAMILVHVLCVGLPISLTISRAERRRVAPAGPRSMITLFRPVVKRAHKTREGCLDEARAASEVGPRRRQCRQCLC